MLDLVEETGAYDDHAQDLEVNAHDAPGIEPDLAEQTRTEREKALRSREQRQAEAERPGIAPGPEQERAADRGRGSTPATAAHPSTEAPPGWGAPHATRQETPESPGAARGPAPAADSATAPDGQERVAPPPPPGRRRPRTAQ
ncbi:hypothetical protein ACFQ3Z_02015 [Streptomyces nogalater]